MRGDSVSTEFLCESYIRPITILSGLPSAGFGALMTLLLFRIDVNIYAFAAPGEELAWIPAGGVICP